MTPQTTIDGLTARLLDALDLEAEHLRRVTEFLGILSRLILKRDEAGLRELFTRVHEETLTHDRNESARHELLASMAEIAGCPVSAVTLTMLERLVGAQQVQHIRRKRQDLSQLIAGLRKQHYGTTMLLGEMIRINRSLLAGITGGCNSTTYGRGGQAKWTGADNILNLRY